MVSFSLFSGDELERHLPEHTDDADVVDVAHKCHATTRHALELFLMAVADQSVKIGAPGMPRKIAAAREAAPALAGLSGVH